MHELLTRVITGNDLSEAEAETLMRHLIDGEHSTSEKAAFLCALKIKGETPSEIVGFSKALKAFASLDRIPGVSDVVGTGGDGQGTVNVSTAAAINAASLGIKMAKHGNRAVSSRMGSADFLERLGYEFQFSRQQAVERLKSSNFLFILAPAFNWSSSHFSPRQPPMRSYARYPARPAPGYITGFNRPQESSFRLTSSLSGGGWGNCLPAGMSFTDLV